MSGSIAAEQDPRFDIFLAWAATQKARAATSTRKRDQFSEKTARIYESLWRGWVDWLGARDLQWPQASAADVRAFLEGPAPAPDDRRTRRPINDRRMANYTQQRYWSVLQQVYSHAKVNGLVELSPCEDVPDQPRITERSHTRRQAPEGVLQPLRDPRELARLLPAESAQQWWVLRDRAAVALVAHCGLTTAELIALRGADLRAGTKPLQGSAQSDLPGIAPAPAAGPVVDVRGPDRSPRNRSLPLPPQAIAVLKPWLECRAILLARQEAKLRLAAGGGAVPATPAQQPLLLSREGPAGEPKPAIDPPTVHKIFKRTLEALLPPRKGEKDVYVARGPSAIRNSVIVEWSRAMPAEKVAALAGIEPRALRAGAGT